MARPKSNKTLINEAIARGETLGNFKSWPQKLASQKNGVRFNDKKKRIGEINCKKVVKNYLKTNDIKKTAKLTGISVTQSTRYLKSEQADKLFKEVFEKIGVDKEKLAEIAFNDFLEYNKQKIIRSDSFGNSVEEMRDGRLAFKALQFTASKLEPDKKEIEINHSVDISSNTAVLAIKQLLNQVSDAKVLHEIIDLVNCKLGITDVIDVN